MKRFSLILLVFLLCTTLGYAVTGSVSSFTSQSNPFNITFTGNQNQSYLINVPSYSYLNLINFSITQIVSPLVFSTVMKNLSQTNITNGTCDMSQGTSLIGSPQNLYDKNITTFTRLYTYCRTSPDPESFGSNNLTYDFRYPFNGSSIIIRMYQKTYGESYLNISMWNFSSSSWEDYPYTLHVLLDEYLENRTIPYSKDFINSSFQGKIKFKTFLPSNMWGSGLGQDIYLYELYFNSSLPVYFYTTIFNGTSPIIVNDSLGNSYISNLSFIFHSDEGGIIQVNLTNASYAYGIDNCSNSFGIPSNATAYNFSFQDTNSNPANVNLTTIISNPYVYYSLNKGINNSKLCTYPNWFNMTNDLNIQYLDSAASSYIDNYPSAIFDNITNNIILYALGSSSQITFTAKDIGTKNVIGGATATQYGLVNGVWVIISSQFTAINGKVIFNYYPSTPYQFLFTAANYQPYPFSYPLVTDAAVDVPMTKIALLNTSIDYERISVGYTTQFYNGTNIFNFMVSSPYNELSAYGYILTYPGGSTFNSGTNIAGEGLSSFITISSTSPSDIVVLNFYYTTLAGTKNFNYTFSIITNGEVFSVNYTNRTALTNVTMMTNTAQTYGLDLLTRILIVTIVTIFVVGISYLIGRGVTGLALGAFLWVYFVYTGFISIWVILMPVTILILILSRRTEGSGY